MAKKPLRPSTSATWDVRGRKATSVAKGLVQIQIMKGERPKALINPEICN
jgi:hypothetical protein